MWISSCKFISFHNMSHQLLQVLQHWIVAQEWDIYIYTCVIKCLYAFIFLYYIHIVYKNCYIWWKPVVSFMVKKLYTVHQIALSSNSEPFVFSRLQIPSCQLQGQRCWDPLHCWWAFLRCLVAFPWQQCALADVRTTCHAQKNMQDR